LAIDEWRHDLQVNADADQVRLNSRKMPARFLITGTLAGGLVLSVLNWLTAAVLPPRYKQFRDSPAVVEAIRANVSGNDIYTAPQGLFVSVSLRPRPQSFGLSIASQFVVEFAVALGLSLLVLATPFRSSIRVASFLGLAGLIAGVETHFPNWNWAGFPTSYLLAGSAYLAGNWFIAGLVLGVVRRKLEADGVAR
jgi:hypothetical protein